MGNSEVESKILTLFRENVKGRNLSAMGAATKHDGAAGHRLETLFGIKHNGDNAPDLLGYELKSDTKSKTTFGDWSADWYLFSRSRGVLKRSDFLRMFGAPNPDKNNRYSWSGSCFPRVGAWNNFGQRINVSPSGSIDIVYSHKHDHRESKSIIVGDSFKFEPQTIAHWSHEKLAAKVNNKFNKSGWFKVFQDDAGTCISLGFGEPFNFQKWIEGVESGEIYLDSGMYDGNLRPYQTWRAPNSYWNGLIVRRYE